MQEVLQLICENLSNLWMYPIFKNFFNSKP